MQRQKGLAVVNSKFQELRQQIKADVNELDGDIKVNPKDVCWYTNSQRKENQGIPSLKRRMVIVWLSMKLSRLRSSMVRLNDWAKILDAGCQLDTFILDFEKAFDTPPHELLKCKLHGYIISGKTLVWIDSFLCNRQQRVFFF